MDRHVIATMGAETGATTSVFPSDDAMRQFLRDGGREADWTGLEADAGAAYDERCWYVEGVINWMRGRIAA